MVTETQENTFQEVFQKLYSEKTSKKQVEDNNLLYEIDNGWQEGIYLFASFDLANSTLFKSRHVALWPMFVSAFYSCVAEAFGVGRYRLNKQGTECSQEYIDELYIKGGFHLWKLVGDEVLLYHKVISKEELYNTIKFIDGKRRGIISNTITKCLEAKANSVNFKEQNCEAERNIYKQYFGLKTTVWMANCAGNEENVSSERQNMVYDSTVLNNESENNEKHMDFLGPDIDEGFRLCSYAEKGQMLVSPKLVHLLLMAFKEDKDTINVLNWNFKIVNYVSMKGVWEQRAYPLIMFCQTEPMSTGALQAWQEQFEYDAFEASLLYENIGKYGAEFFQNKRFSVLNLKKIYTDIIREKEMENLKINFLEQEKNMKVSGIGEKCKPEKFEFHISCLCYDKPEKKIWITNHEIHGWSFGCVQVNQIERYYEHVEQVYESKYNLKVNLDDNSPMISFYTARRSPIKGGIILGVVLLVDEVTCLGVKPGVEAKWVTLEEARKLADDGNVNKLKEFSDIIEKVRQLISRKKSEIT